MAAVFVSWLEPGWSSLASFVNSWYAVGSWIVTSAAILLSIKYLYLAANFLWNLLKTLMGARATQGDPARRLLGLSAQGLTDMAALFAGRNRPGLREEWRAHLAGEDGRELTDARKLLSAIGFVLAAIHYRLQDAADFAWRPVDALLASRELSNLFVLASTLGVVVLFASHGGLYNLAINLGSVAVVWGGAFGLIRVGRQWRDVRPPERKPRRAKQ